VSGDSSHGTGTGSNSAWNQNNTSGSTSGNAMGSPQSNESASMSNGNSHGTNAGSANSTWNNSGSSNQNGTAYGSSGVASVSNGSAHGTNSPGASGSAENNPNAGSDNNGSMRTVTGAVAKVDQGSITLDQSAGGVTLTVDSNTQIMRRGHAVSQVISAIHEGTKVRASFDPASNRADKIEVMGTNKHHHQSSTSGTTDSQPKQ